MKKKYILCPRCELNYIPADDPARKYCDVCLSELNLIENKLIPDEDSELVLCPRCKTNYIMPDEDMCESCRESEKKLPEEPDPAWTEDFDAAEETADDEPVEISFDEVAEEEEAGEHDESAPFDEEDTFNNEEEFEEVNIDDEEFDDDEEEEEDGDVEDPE